MSADRAPAGLGPGDRVRRTRYPLGSLIVLIGSGLPLAGAARPVLGYLSIECGSTDAAGPFLCRPGVVPTLGGLAWAGWAVAVLLVVVGAVAVRRGRPSTGWVAAGWTVAASTLLGLVVAGGMR